MIYTVKDGVRFCAKFIDGGRDPSDPKCIERLNDCEMILKEEVNTLDLTRVCKFFIGSGKTLALPETVESVIRVTANGNTAYVRGVGYEFLDSGPGEEMSHAGRSAGQDLKDMGDGFPTFYPVGADPRRLIAMSDNPADIGKEIRVRGYDAMSCTITDNGPGEMLKISGWQGGIEGEIDSTTVSLTKNEFQEVTSIIKPATTGHISFYSYDTDTYDLGFLSKYAPHETQPGYRRYQITNKAFSASTYINTLVKLRHVPLRHDSDPLMIQSLHALQYMCQSLHEQSSGNQKASMAFQAQAVRALLKQSTNKQTDEAIIDFDVDMAFGAIGEL